MLKNVLWAGLSFVVVALATTSSSCSGTRNVCTDKNVRCDEPLSCDPADGICKCGGRGGVVCPDGFACDPVANTCLSTRCVVEGRRVDCSAEEGTSCDVNDGKCKCGGTGGLTCASNEYCDAPSKSCKLKASCLATSCPRNQTCDVATSRCLCAGSTCTGDRTCSVSGAANTPTCVDNVCKGVSCTGANACDAVDGLCKCNGVVCQSGEACACPADAGVSADGGTCASTARSCRSSSACQGVNCSNGTTCDPVDGQCKCGGPGGQRCTSDQICALGPPPQCQGGQQCVLADGGTKVCGGGTSCDPEDGRCKCGGRGGLVCAPVVLADAGTPNPGEVCVLSAVQTVCRRPCDVRNPDCPSGTFCFFDSAAATPVAYCSAAAAVTKNEAEGCTSPTQCFSSTPTPRALHCNGLVLGTAGLCRAYCDTSAGTTGCIQTPNPQNCVQIIGAPTGYGVCLAN